MWLVGAVARSMIHTLDSSLILDLVGGQCWENFHYCRRLGGDWYTDSVTDFCKQDSYDVCKSLLANSGEIASNRMSLQKQKLFMAKTSLRYRKATYMKRTEEFAKNFILARTTIKKEYLKDKTGAQVLACDGKHKRTSQAPNR